MLSAAAPLSVTFLVVSATFVCTVVAADGFSFLSLTNKPSSRTCLFLPMKAVQLRRKFDRRRNTTAEETLHLVGELGLSCWFEFLYLLCSETVTAYLMLFDTRLHDKNNGRVATETTSSKEKILEVWRIIPANFSRPSEHREWLRFALLLRGWESACHERNDWAGLQHFLKQGTPWKRNTPSQWSYCGLLHNMGEGTQKRTQKGSYPLQIS